MILAKIIKCRSRLLYLTLILVALSGCTSVPVKHEELKQRGISLDSKDYFKNENFRLKFEKEWRNDKAPEVGLALAGGGTKAGDFALGVLQGLEESKIMDKVDIMSTVSGGGYAALWYYTRVINEINKSYIEAFVDCLPSKYSIYVKEGCENPTYVCPPKNRTNYLDANGDPYRHQNYLRGYQDVFSSGSDLLGNKSFNYNTFEDQDRLINDIGMLSAKTLGAAVVNVIPNILFDWQVPLSPSRNAYAKGIARTFGAIPPSCSDNVNSCDSEGKWRAEGDINAAKNIKFEDMKRVYIENRAPMWIINATAGEDRTPWDFKSQQDPELTVFEFTPYGSGSGIYGYDNPPDWLSPFEAVIASAAFLDSQQKNVSKPPLRNLFSAFMELSTLNWGSSYINPKASWPNVAIHEILPWPLYYFHKFNAGSDSMYLHLSDGGQSEDLGAYSLIRRKLSKIIISDHSHDRAGLMDDVCRLKVTLGKNGLYLHIPGLKNFDMVCSPKENQNGDKLHGYDIFNWDHPVLLGCVTSNKDEINCIRSVTEKDSNYYFAQLFIIKPALADKKLKSAITDVASICRIKDKDGSITEECRNVVSSKCEFLMANSIYLPQKNVQFIDSDNPWKFEDYQSCELLGFIVENAFKGLGINSTDGCPHFPQYSTITMTLKSSPWMYGASRELGRRYARQLGWFFQADKAINDSRFIEALRFQADHPIEDKITIPKFMNAAKSGEPRDCSELGSK